MKYKMVYPTVKSSVALGL